MTSHWTPRPDDFPRAIDERVEGLIFGNSPDMRRLKETISLVGPASAPVMVQGETGTGKELVAQALHMVSGRAGDMVAVNCAAIPANLLESELFGHEKGAFTGADERRIGRIEQAQGGTLFLDEIGDMPVELQAKLLRVLETRRVQRLGGRSEVEVDFRLVTATHRNIADSVVAGQFRMDLYYRIAVFPLTVPRLVERREDIPVLLKAMTMMMRIGGARGPAPQFSAAALRALERHDWPGNVRELRNVFERACVLYAGREITVRDVEEHLLLQVTPRAEAAPAATAAPTACAPEKIRETLQEQGFVDLRGYLQGIEEAMINVALDVNRGCVSHAAQALRLQRTTLIQKMKKLCISVQKAA